MTIPCKWCGSPTEMRGTKMCDPCWELERGLLSRPDIARRMLAELKPPVPVSTTVSAEMYSDTDLVWRAVRNARPRGRKAARWVAMMDTFGLGSTFARDMCVIHDLDPDEIIEGDKP